MRYEKHSKISALLVVLILLQTSRQSLLFSQPSELSGSQAEEPVGNEFNRERRFLEEDQDSAREEEAEMEHDLAEGNDLNAMERVIDIRTTMYVLIGVILLIFFFGLICFCCSIKECRRVDPYSSDEE